MRSEKFNDHFQNPRNVGELAAPAVPVDAANPVCGDTLRLSVLFEDGRVAAAAFRTRGCAASIACGSVLTELIQGRNREQLNALSANDITAQLGGLPPESGHAAALCIDAVRALLARVPVK